MGGGRVREGGEGCQERGCGREGVNPVRGNQAVVSVGDEGERVTEGGIHGGGRW